MKEFVVPALVPGCCPIFPRHRWVGADVAIDWVGLREAHHGLLSAAFERMQAADQPHHPHPTESELGWDSVFGLAAAIDDGLGGDPGNAHEGEDAGEDEGHGPVVDIDLAQPSDAQETAEPLDPETWAERNKKYKSEGLKWLQSLPLFRLVVMRITMEPMTALVRDMLYISGQQWEKGELDAAAQGKPRSYRVLEAFKGTHTNKFMNTVGCLMHEPNDKWIALPLSNCTEKASVLAFCMLAKGVASNFRPWCGHTWDTHTRFSAPCWAKTNVVKF